MCLVHDDVADIHLRQVAAKQEGRKAFRRNVQELEVSVAGIVKDGIDLVPAHTGMNSKSFDAAVL